MIFKTCLEHVFFSSKVDKMGSKSDTSDTGFIHKVTLQLWEKSDLELDHREKDRYLFMSTYWPYGVREEVPFEKCLLAYKTIFFQQKLLKIS